MNKVKRRELWSNVLMLALAALIAAWLGFAWTAATGLTFVGSRSYSEGRWANAEDRTRVRHVAVMTTVIAGPVALWAAMMRKRSD